MHSPLTAEDLIAYHKATGCPLSYARKELSAMEPSLRERILIASRNYDGESIGLTDPIEQDAVIRRRVRQAAIKAQRLVKGDGLGTCHAIWAEQARILQEEYGIRWYSPAQMNPGTCFD